MKKQKKDIHTEDAELFAKELAKHLAVSAENVSAAYEDVFYFLWTEGKLPVNIDPLKIKFKRFIGTKNTCTIIGYRTWIIPPVLYCR